MAQEGAASILGVAIRDVARLQTVAAIVAKHGFGEVLARMPFAKAVALYTCPCAMNRLAIPRWSSTSIARG